MADPLFFEDTELYRAHMSAAGIPFPDVIQFEVTSECNLRCIMCPLTTENRTRTEQEKFFTLAQCEKLSELFEHASEVELTGFGEIFTHPQILEILRFLKSRGLGIYGTSNGTLLFPELSEAIVAEGLMDVLCFSIDAATGPTYRRIRRGGRFEVMSSNIRALDRIKTERGSEIPIVYFSFAAMERNIRELPDFVRLAAQSGARKVIVQHVVENRLTLGQNLTGHRELAAEFIPLAREAAAETGIELDLRNLDPVQDGPAESLDQGTLPTPAAFKQKNRLVKDCPFPWEHIFLKSNYDVQICAILWEQMIMGNLKRESIQQIWNSESYARLRRQMCGTDAPEECVYCYFKGWRRPTPVQSVSGAVTMSREHAGQMGRGWHLIEHDPKGREHRWSKKEATLFVRNNGGTVLSVEIYEHPEGPFLRGAVLINGKRVAQFTSHDIWGIPLRFAVGSFEDEFLQVSFEFERTWHPGKRLGMVGKRWIGALFYGAELTLPAGELEPSITPGKDLDPQMCLGWMLPEQIGRKTACWIQGRAQAVLPGGGTGEILVEAMLPKGMEAARIEAWVNDHKTGEIDLAPDGRFRAYRVPAGPSESSHRILTLRLADYDPRGTGKRDERPLAALVSRIELSQGGKFPRPRLLRGLGKSKR